MLCFVIFRISFRLSLRLKIFIFWSRVGLGLILKIHDWILIVKYDSLLISNVD